MCARASFTKAESISASSRIALIFYEASLKPVSVAADVLAEEEEAPRGLLQGIDCSGTQQPACIFQWQRVRQPRALCP